MSKGGDEPRVFVTHSSIDRALADRIVHALRMGTDVRRARIFCSSIEGCGVPTGADFMTYIQRQLQDTKLVVPLITPAYLDSIFCQWELGAAWVQNVRMFPIKVDAVDHTELVGPLHTMQTADFNTAGLNDLASAVAEAVGGALHLTEWESERDPLLRDLQQLTAKLAKEWRATPSAKLRRAARLSDHSRTLHRIFHILRDAAYLQVLHGSPEGQRNHFLSLLNSCVEEVAYCFSGITGQPCRVAVKQVTADDSPRVLYVQDLARSGSTPLRRTREPIAENTDFEDLMVGGCDYFLCNNIRERISEGSYKNSHLIPAEGGLPYNSTIVCPVRKVLTDPPSEAVRLKTASDWQDLIAYLCVDSSSTDTFTDADIQVGAGIADAMYSVLRPYS